MSHLIRIYTVCKLYLFNFSIDCVKCTYRVVMVIRFTDWLLKMLIFDVRCLCLQSVTDKMSKSLVCF